MILSRLKSRLKSRLSWWWLTLCLLHVVSSCCLCLSIVSLEFCSLNLLLLLSLPLHLQALYLLLNHHFVFKTRRERTESWEEWFVSCFANTRIECVCLFLCNTYITMDTTWFIIKFLCSLCMHFLMNSCVRNKIRRKETPVIYSQHFSWFPSPRE